MSGLKESEIALKKEKEEKIKSINKITEMRGKLAGISTIMKNTLQNAPQGVKTTFEKDVDASLSWIRQFERSDKEKYTLDANQEKLNSVLLSLENQLNNGQNIFAALTTSLTQKANVLEKSLYIGLDQLRCTYTGYQEIMKTWFEDDTVKGIEASIDKIGGVLRQKQFSQAESFMAEIVSTIKSRVDEAKELEYKHQKRMYVLKALRQVCTEMGFEDSEPSFEKPGNRNRIIYEVDTFSQGKLRFYLTLDGISSHSGIIESKCLDEFDKLSTSLEEEFGVKTKFKVTGEAPMERLIHKGEINEPEGTQMEKSA
jgi:hypothetical protein